MGLERDDVLKRILRYINASIRFFLEEILSFTETFERERIESLAATDVHQ